ncbi:oligosaccharide flippase family protein [Geodermatophilus sp. SYSU D00691]
MTSWVLRLLRRRATAAVLGQGTQAVAGLALQVAAARLLGAGGLAVFALVYGALVLVTAVCSGMVGDSLTVLDRRERGVRAGLHVWTVLVSTAAALAGAGAALVSGLVPVWAGLLLGPACAAFVVEDTLRRLLMATGRYRALPVVDTTSLVGAMAALGAAGLAGGVTLSSFVVALLAGQTAAAVVAWFLVPGPERPSGPWRRPDLRAVAAFGTWRAAAQTIRPVSLTLLRVLVVAAVGAAAYGPLEAARVYTAPMLTLVAGVGSFLLPHFVVLRDRGAAAPSALRTADRAALGLTAGILLIGAAGLGALPWLGPALTGGGYAVPVAAVIGWTAYAAAGAVLLPYSSLASVHGGQQRVLLLRILEFGSLGAVAALVLLAPGSVAWAPLALAAGPALTAVAVRQAVVVPMTRRARRQPEPVPA